MAMLTLTNISKHYPGNVRAVDDFTLTVADGEFVVLVGPSGCGKTTTLRLIAGLERPSSGRMTIAGRSVEGVSPRDRDVAMVFQNYALYPHLSVYGNLAFALKMRRTGKAEIARRVDEAAHMLGIAGLLDRRPSELSGGQRQRVALGRAMVRRPKIFLFDEPLSNLDTALRAEMRRHLRRLHAQFGTTTIYVTHDQSEAMTLGQRIVVLREGRIQQVADPATLYQRPANRFVAGLIGSPTMNFADGHLKRGEDGLIFRAEDFSVPLPESRTAALSPFIGRPVTLGIRPEHVSLAGDGRSADGVAIRGSVEAIENLGAECYVYVSTPRHSLVARTHSAGAIQVGQQIGVLLATEHAHLFAQEKGESLTS